MCGKIISGLFPCRVNIWGVFENLPAGQARVPHGLMRAKTDMPFLHPSLSKYDDSGNYSVSNSGFIDVDVHTGSRLEGGFQGGI